MKKLFNLSMLAIAAMAAFSCTMEPVMDQELQEPQKVFEPKVITAYTDADVNADTKTSLSGVSILWATTDNIKGWDGLTVHTSTSTAVSDGNKKADFTFETVNVEDDLLYLAYPAENVSDIDDDFVYATIPTTQTATAGSFADGANVAVADGLTNNPIFKNVGGLLSFTFNNDNITSVTLFADEDLTGASKISMSGVFAEATILDGKNFVTVSGTIANGSTYFAVVYPGTYHNLKIEVRNTAGQVATYTNPNALEVGRNANLHIATLTIPDGKWVTPTKGSEYAWNAVLADFGSAGSPKASITAGSPSITWTPEYTWGNPATATKHLGTDASKGVQIGSGSDANKCSSLVLSTSGYTQYVESIRINFSHANSGGASVSVKVGETSLKNSGNTSVNASNTPANYTFTGGSLVKGDIVITFENSASKAFYIKSIVINPDDRTPVTLSFSNDAIEDQTTVSHTFTGQAVSSSPDVSAITSNITWSITGDTITSSFNTSTGALVLSGAVGTATVTASFAGDENYKSANASYSITVSKVKLATPTSPVAAEKSGDDAIVVTLPTGVSNVGSYSVTCTGETTQVVVSGTPSVTFSSLSDGSYTVTVTAIPSDTSVYLNSDAWSSPEITIGDLSLFATLYDTDLVLPQGTSTSYESRSYTDDKGNTWNTFSACANPSKSPTYPMIQLRAQTSTKAAYIQIPTMPSDIKTISFIVTGSSATAENGDATTTKLQFQTTTAYNASVILEGGGSSTNSITLDFTGKSYKTGYITANGSLRIWKIVVEY